MCDLIRRCDVLDNINKRIYYFDKTSFDEAVKAVYNSPSVDATPRWISVEERLPENKQMVIGFTPCDGYMFVGYYVDDQKWKQWYIVTAMRSTKYMTKKVTHWMYLPPAPEEDSHV